MSRLMRKLWLPFALAVAVALLSLAAVRRPIPVIEEGTDCWVTEEGTEQELKTLPMDYLSPGSQVVHKHTIRLEGVPLDPAFVAAPYPRGCGCPEKVTTVVTWRDRHGNVTKDMRHAVSKNVDQTSRVDTCVRRTVAAQLGNGKRPVKVAIELVALSLKSVEPLTVPYKDGPEKKFDVFITNVDPSEQKPREGSMTFTPNRFGKDGSASGAVLLSALHVDYKVEFREIGGSLTKTDTAKLTLQGTKGNFDKK